MLPPADTFPGALPQQLPARRAVTHPAVVCRIHERLHQHRPITPPRLPIVLHATGKLTKNVAH